MPYNDTEYAILVTAGLGMSGEKAVQYLKEEFKIDMHIRTYYREVAHLTSQFPMELKYQFDNRVKQHMARLHLFYHTRTLLKTCLENEENWSKKALIIKRIDDHEVLIAQLEALSSRYYLDNLKQIASNPLTEENALKALTV